MTKLTITETVWLEDRLVFTIMAAGFPQGVLEAHQKLHALIPYEAKRQYYGISFPNKDGHIKYMAGAEELNKGELSKHGLVTFILKKGNYTCIDLHDFRSQPERIQEAFQVLIHQKGIDPNGCCVEWYQHPASVKCLVRMDVAE